MAKIIEHVLVIKFSKIAKDSESESAAVVSADIQQALDQVAQELVGSSIVVEIEQA